MLKGPPSTALVQPGQWALGRAGNTMSRRAREPVPAELSGSPFHGRGSVVESRRARSGSVTPPARGINPAMKLAAVGRFGPVPTHHSARGRATRQRRPLRCPIPPNGRPRGASSSSTSSPCDSASRRPASGAASCFAGADRLELVASQAGELQQLVEPLSLDRLGERLVLGGERGEVLAMVAGPLSGLVGPQRSVPSFRAPGHHVPQRLHLGQLVVTGRRIGVVGDVDVETVGLPAPVAAT